MTPPLIDQGVARDDPARSLGARDVGVDVPIRFADVMVSKDTTSDRAASARLEVPSRVLTVTLTDVSKRDRVMGVPTTPVRVLDQVSVFDRPAADVPPTDSDWPWISEVAIILSDTDTIPLAPGPVARMFPSAPAGQSLSTTSVVIASEPKSDEATAAIPDPRGAASLDEVRPISVQTTTSEPDGESSAAQRLLHRSTTPPPAAAVVVEVHASARGIEVVAQRGPTAPSMDVSKRDGVAGVPTTQARIFNQDGFFGRPEADAPSLRPSSPAVSEAAMINTGAATIPIPISIGAGPVGGVFPPAATGQSFSAASVVIASAPKSSEAMATVPNPRGAAPPGEVRPISIRTTTGEPYGKSSVERLLLHRPTPPAASVTVAVHAAARSMEVVAQVAGLDERERATLADEIAALLSAHGYPPAHISVIAAARAARQEHR
ncbi:hypothetical protein [Sphingomonas sp. Leaf33]|uniref:hypothetical protein n=1 Tax=Sphingomonas sp. Leaf33 TaxID=1736215 RepID=UPI000B0AE357|nr:hypothetical protein [Sphingomonas sp. Leaf33]